MTDRKPSPFTKLCRPLYGVQSRGVLPHTPQREALPVTTRQRNDDRVLISAGSLQNCFRLCKNDNLKYSW
jgi:hypothetical protein